MRRELSGTISSPTSLLPFAGDWLRYGPLNSLRYSSWPRLFPKAGCLDLNDMESIADSLYWIGSLKTWATFFPSTSKNVQQIHTHRDIYSILALGAKSMVNRPSGTGVHIAISQSIAEDLICYLEAATKCKIRGYGSWACLAKIRSKELFAAMRARMCVIQGFSAKGKISKYAANLPRFLPK